MTAHQPSHQAAERFADALYDRFCAFARSWGLLDIAVEADGTHVDGELMFVTGPDMGFTFDIEAQACQYCVLEGDDGERWLEDPVEGFSVLPTGDEDALAAEVQRLLDGLLAARRPLL